MINRKTCKASNRLLVLTGLCWMATIALAALDWHGAVTGRTFALAALAGAATTATIIINSRQVGTASTRVVTVAVARAPRESFWRGYEARGEDMAATSVDDTIDLASFRR
ncbi:hypothetical protein ACH4T9_31020 [Micromonospora sp. NPDC020750]|uniref:hypothetical protein n=1 Tax=unclassified Micromonospora TaxID=2617518 RepID=UPI003795C793